jgi:replication factor C subunit 2/4
MIFEAYSGSQLISQLHDSLIERGDITDAKKSYIFEKIATVDNNLLEGADEYLQILDLSLFIMKQICSK